MHRALATYATRTVDSDAESVLARYSSLIDRTARRMVARTGLHNHYDDLWSAGALGLLEARNRYDGSKGATFETFATHRIRGAMLDELRKLDHLPRRLREKTDDVKTTRKKLGQSLGRDATVEEIASAMNIDPEELSGLEGLLEPHISLDSILPSLSAESDADEALDRGRLVVALAAAIEALPDRLKTLVALHYQEGLSYREISGILDVSEPRICQLHADAMRILRTRLRSEDNEGNPGRTGVSPAGRPRAKVTKP